MRPHRCRRLWSTLLLLGCVGEAGPVDRQMVEVHLPPSGPWVGREDAPLALVEFGSHGCGGCWRFTFEGLPRLLAEFVEPGALRYRYVDVAGSPVAALAECRAAAAGFVAARAALYRALRDSTSAGAAGGAMVIPADCLADSAGARRRRLEAEVARRLNVPGTPTFVIGRGYPGGRVVGWVELGFVSADSLVSVVRAARRLVEDR